jgi:hypothetical protein
MAEGMGTGGLVSTATVSAPAAVVSTVTPQATQAVSATGLLDTILGGTKSAAENLAAVAGAAGAVRASVDTITAAAAGGSSTPTQTAKQSASENAPLIVGGVLAVLFLIGSK